MDNKHRKHIEKHIDKLISLTDYDALIQACLDINMLNGTMRRTIETFDIGSMSTNDVRREQHRRLFQRITQRGPTAYEGLKTILLFQNRNEPLALLQTVGNVDFVSVHQNDNSIQLLRNAESCRRQHETQSQSRNNATNENRLPLCEYTEPIQPTNNHAVIKSMRVYIDSKIAIDPSRISEYNRINTKVGLYPMRTLRNRGVFFMTNIIHIPNQEKRSGSKEDFQSLLNLFKALGFKLFAYTDLTKAQFFMLLDELLESNYTRDAECFVMALMTHGYTDHVQFHDGAIVKVVDIEKRFENKNCKHLQNTPKLFIFPFCRGSIRDKGHPYISNKNSSKTPTQNSVSTDGGMEAPPNAIYMNIPSSLTDTIICYATMTNFKAHRDIKDGSWYIQKLCELMSMHAHDIHIEDILKMVQNETNERRCPDQGTMQAGNYVNYSFNKHMYFNPGVHDID